MGTDSSESDACSGAHTQLSMDRSGDESRGFGGGHARGPREAHERSGEEAPWREQMCGVRAAVQPWAWA